MEKHAPVKQLKFKNNDKPWITLKFKEFISLRDEAYQCDDLPRYRKLRNLVNRLRKSLRTNYIENKINKLGDYGSRRWWKEIKEICGLKNNAVGSFDNCNFQGHPVAVSELPEVLNKYFVAITDAVPVLCNNAGSVLSMPNSETTVSEFDIYKILDSLKVGKASLFDSIDNKLLKNLADVLASPICCLVNSSFRSGIVPNQWKMSRIAPLPKHLPVCDIDKDIRPIAITCPISKVAEYFMSVYFDEHFDALLDDGQFGCTRGRSTTLALVEFAHMLFESSDDSMNIIRVMFVDFSKAFDLIDHNVIASKLSVNKFPESFSTWFLSFLSDRVQFVRIGDVSSELLHTNAGAPQGTRAGPNAFKLMINDLKFNLTYIKYVDDVTFASVSHDSDDSSLQEAVDHLALWCHVNGMRLNTDKTKEMIVLFNKRVCLDDITPIVVNSSTIERVDDFKLLGVYFSSDLTWNKHVNVITAKASKRIYVLCHLIRSGFNREDVIKLYCSLIRPILEYACEVWHCGLTQKLSDEIEAVQRRCMKVIFPYLSYADATAVAQLETLSSRREKAVIKLFNEIKSDSHVLHHLLPFKLSLSRTVIRNVYPFNIPIARTSRRMRSLISYCISKRI